MHHALENIERIRVYNRSFLFKDANLEEQSSSPKFESYFSAFISKFNKNAKLWEYHVITNPNLENAILVLFSSEEKTWKSLFWKN